MPCPPNHAAQKHVYPKLQGGKQLSNALPPEDFVLQKEGDVSKFYKTETCAIALRYFAITLEVHRRRGTTINDVADGVFGVFRVVPSAAKLRSTSEHALYF